MSLWITPALAPEVIHSGLPPESGGKSLWITPAPAPEVIHSELPPESGGKSLWIMRLGGHPARSSAAVAAVWVEVPQGDGRV
jgi:hypothetical protein